MPITDFIGRICLSENKPPIRAYVHKIGFAEAYSSYIKDAEKHLKHVMTDYKKELSKFQYILASMWGDKGDKILKMFGYSGITRWPGNPELHAWVVKNGIFVQGDQTHSTIHEDTSIVLGREEEHRRNRKGLKDFISNPPLFISDEKGQTKIVPLVKTR